MFEAVRLARPRSHRFLFTPSRACTVARRRFSASSLCHEVSQDRIRNIAIIAHVDHGKTTLVDQLLRQSGTIKRLSAEEQLLLTPSAASGSGSGDSVFDGGFVTRVMDSNDLERERGITILSKCTSINYKDHLINIVDTPGHADFGGEVERIMSMVDAVALVVDATEGPMTQTRFVLSKALKRGLRPLVVMNKADRDTARPAQVEDDLFDLFATLEATDEQMDYPLLYASAKQGWAQETLPSAEELAAIQTEVDNPNHVSTKMTPLLDLIVSHVPPPTHLSVTSPFKMMIVQIEADSFLGNLYVGRIHSGTLRVGDNLIALDSEGNKVGDGKVKKVCSRLGVDRTELDEASAGQIVSIAGIKGGGVNVTLVAADGWGPEGPEPLPSTPIDPPTVSVTIHANDSPLAGKEGTKLTSQMLRDRIHKEAETNVALAVLPGPTSESMELRGRGVLHLGVLFETLRREGFEFSISAPKAVMIPDPDDKFGKLEPIEECTIIVKDEWAGSVVQKLTMRKAEMKLYEPAEPGFSKIIMDVPARGLIGYMAGEFKNDVHGEGTINHIFKGYEKYKGAMDTGRNGALISMAAGETSAYAMYPLQARGTMFIHPQTIVYPGMVIGEANRNQDMYINPTVKKQLTNIRSAGADEKLVMASPRIMNMEESIAYMSDDEMVEITPKSVRLRKVILDQGKRTRSLSGKKG
ncbi:GTP-binding protein TypA [Flagelloscypha sp. PMI_526]|nr:GTP-binding protein TypA [Flagelloscypha sp. PMI_526]